MTLADLLRRLWRGRPKVEQTPGPDTREPLDIIVILDGTLSSLEPGQETNAGLIYHTLQRVGGGHMAIRYEPGIQWTSWRATRDVLEGRGINRQIRRAYGYIASRYRPGDRIFLIGYSRGAFAARSLAGLIDRVGLLRKNFATVRHIRGAYRHYRDGGDSAAAQAFAQAHCHPSVRIEAVAVFDTVKALGLRLPLLWRLTERRHAFHNHVLGDSIAHGFHAIALHENRVAFAPVMWRCPGDWDGTMQQVWFRGSHGDVGGHLKGMDAARPLSNIPLVWMLERLEQCKLPLPHRWRDDFPQDTSAPSTGTLRKLGWLFLARRDRVVGRDRSESIHPSAATMEGSGDVS